MVHQGAPFMSFIWCHRGARQIGGCGVHHPLNTPHHLRHPPVTTGPRTAAGESDPQTDAYIRRLSSRSANDTSACPLQHGTLFYRTCVKYRHLTDKLWQFDSAFLDTRMSRYLLFTNFMATLYEGSNFNSGNYLFTTDTK